MGSQIIVQIILARLLLPEQFGLIAMLTILIAVAQSFVDSGFGQALIQKKDASRIDESSIFYFNIIIGFIATGLLCFIAPLIAAFYEIPELCIITRVLSLNLIINSFGLIQISLLTKQINFKTQMKASLTATMISGVAGISLAYMGWGVWSLVVQLLSFSLFRTIMLWLAYSWRPMFVFSIVSLRGMFAFGSKMLFSGLLDTIYRNIYLIVIGKIYLPADLGFYSQAKTIQQVPVASISGIISRVTFPIFSAVQDDKERLKRGVREALKVMAWVIFPIMIGLAVCAKPLIQVLLTAKWLPAVPYLQLLCFVGIMYPLHVINLNVLMAQGRSDLFFRLELIKKMNSTIAIFITYRWGIRAMIFGQIATSLIGYYLNSYYTAKHIKYPITEQIIDLLPTLAIALFMGIAVFVITLMPIQNQLFILLLQVVTGALIYIGLCWIFKISSLVYIVNKSKSVLTKFSILNNS